MSDKVIIETKDGQSHSGEVLSSKGDGGYQSCAVDRVLFGGSGGTGSTTIRDDSGNVITGKRTGSK